MRARVAKLHSIFLQGGVVALNIIWNLDFDWVRTITHSIVFQSIYFPDLMMLTQCLLQDGTDYVAVYTSKIFIA